MFQLVNVRYNIWRLLAKSLMPFADGVLFDMFA